MAPAKQDERSAVVIDGLTKRFGDVVAVNGLNLSIRAGELFGFLGPNGAGKTTTIRILCGLTRATSGSAIVGGFDVRREPREVHRRIGVSPQEVAAFGFLTGKENVELFGRLHGLDAGTARERTAKLVEEAGFGEAAGRRVKGYSGGMRRQLNLLIALVSDPEIIFLDEPTAGLDARARRRTWDYIGSLKGSGKTVVLTTHYIEEAQALSDRVGIIDYGELIALGTPAALMSENAAPDLESVFLKITGRRIAEGS